MNIRSLALLLGVVTVGTAPVAASPPVLALGGLDPVELVDGKETAGLENLTTEHGRHRYRFARPENKARFERDTAAYSAQMGGACARMGPLSGQGKPDLFLVHDRKIYLFAHELCRNAFKAAPAKYLQPEAAPAVGTDAEQKRGRELVERALVGLGGAEKVDAVRTLQLRTTVTYPQGGQAVTGQRNLTVVFPRQFRSEEVWGQWVGADVVDGGGGFRVSGKEAWPMVADEPTELVRQCLRQPLVLLRLRNEAGFSAVARGAGMVGGMAVEWLDLRLHGTTVRLGVDPTSGRILRVHHRVYSAAGPLVAETSLADFRPVAGLLLPYAAETQVNGRKQPKPEVQSVVVNGELDRSLFSCPK